MWFLCAPTVQLVDQPYTTFSFVIGFEIHNQRPQHVGFHILDDQNSCQPVIRQEKLLWFPTNTIGKPKGVWPTFVSFPGAHAFQGDGPGLVYHHASAT